MIHYHIYFGSDVLFHNEVEYDDAEESIRAFLDMTEGFVGHIRPTPDDTEVAMFDLAMTGKNSALYVEAGAMKIIWVVCEDVCVKSMRN